MISFSFATPKEDDELRRITVSLTPGRKNTNHKINLSRVTPVPVKMAVVLETFCLHNWARLPPKILEHTPGQTK